MKSNRRAVLKSLVASVTGVAGAGLIGSASAESKSDAAATHEALGNAKDQQVIPVFSPSTQHGNLVFISGQGYHQPPYTIKNHSKQVMGLLKTAIETAGSSMDKVLECYCYVDDPASYAEMNKAFDKAFPKGKRPARTMICVAKGGIPGTSVCEVDAICYI